MDNELTVGYLINLIVNLPRDMKVIMQDKNGRWVMRNSEIRVDQFDVEDENRGEYDENMETVKYGEKYLNIFHSV